MLGQLLCIVHDPTGPVGDMTVRRLWSSRSILDGALDDLALSIFLITADLILSAPSFVSPSPIQRFEPL